MDYSSKSNEELGSIIDGLNEQLKNLKLVEKNVYDSVAIHDPEGIFVYVTPSIEQLLGYTPAEIIGKDPYDYIHSDDTVNVQKNIHIKALEGVEVTKEQLRFRTKTGEYRWLEVYSTPARDDDGNVVQIVSVSRDIGHRKEIEAKLKESERKLETLIKNLPGMVYRCLNDHDWKMEFVSQGSLALTGYAADELVANREKSYNDLINKSDQQRIWNQVQEAVQFKKPFHLEYRIHTKSGEERWVWEQGQGVFSDSGALVALEGFITDLTLLRKAHKLDY